MIFYMMSDDNEWVEIKDIGDIIYRRGLNNWFAYDHTQEKIFHQRLGNKWDPATQKEQKLQRPYYYY